MGIFDKFKIGFKKSASALTSGLKEIIIKKEIDDKNLNKIEEFLIESDVGVEAASEIKEIISSKKIDPNKDLSTEINLILKEYIINLMKPLENNSFFEKKDKLNATLISGVNGVGKTTTIGKIGKILKKETIFCERVKGKFTLRRGFSINKGAKVLIVEDVITTGSNTPRPEKAIIREAFDDFNERNPLAGGGMLVQPSTDGSRPGYAMTDREKNIARIAREKIPGQYITPLRRKFDGQKFISVKDPTYSDGRKRVKTPEYEAFLEKARAEKKPATFGKKTIREVEDGVLLQIAEAMQKADIEDDAEYLMRNKAATKLLEKQQASARKKAGKKVYKQNSIFVLRSVKFSLTLVLSKLTIFFLTKKIILNPFSAFIVLSISLADLFA